MPWEPRPVPVVTPETERFWAGAAEGCLCLSHCRECDLTFFYPRAHCPDCFADAVEWIDAEGTGTVYSHTSTSVVEGWPEEHLPLTLAYVELAEGPRVLTALVNCEPDDVEVGLAVEVTFVQTRQDDVAVPVFQPAE